MGYTCLKMATFGGVKYRPGDVVEAEMIQPGSARAMQDMGIIAEFQDTVRSFALDGSAQRSPKKVLASALCLG